MKVGILNNDNSVFIEKLNTIIQNVVIIWNPDDLVITRVGNWFDSKWLKFSGTIKHEISIWKDELTIPPFHPNRIENTETYIKKNGKYTKQKSNKPLHILQESKSNLSRKLSLYSNNGLFIWYSGNSKTNKRDVIMCYLINEDKSFAFYVSFNADTNWGIEKTKGIPKQIIQNLLEK